MLKTAFFFQVEQIEWVGVKGLSTWDFAMETWKKYTIKIDDIQFGIIKIITHAIRSCQLLYTNSISGVISALAWLNSTYNRFLLQYNEYF